MTIHSLLLLKMPPPVEFPAEAPREWIVTNGLGGYALGSVEGPPLRRFHGLLVAARPAPEGRVMMLHAIDEVVELADGRTIRLRPGRADAPTAELVEFYLQAGLPRWTFKIDADLIVEHAVMMPHGQNTVHLRYRLTGGSAPVRMTLRPWLDFRPHEGPLHAEQRRAYAMTSTRPSACQVSVDDRPSVLRMHATGRDASFAPKPENWNQVIYRMDHERGYEHLGSMYTPGDFTVAMCAGEEVFLTASSESWDRLDALAAPDAYELELSRRERLLQASVASLQSPETFLLPLAADAFIVQPATRDETPVKAAGAEPRSVIAGYPWFTDWGRDTMISLEGLALVTGRHQEARDILRTFALHVREGLIPNLFPEGERQGLYHTADATLWFFHALHRYESITGDLTLVLELLPTLEAIIKCHLEGTRFNIRVDADGLLTQGAEGYQLTWMDAKVDDWVVTPRRGKPVEINALWHNALMLLQSWLSRAGRGALADEVARDAQRCRDSFNRRFWNAATGHLFDVVEGEHGDDASCRPNQVIAIAVTHSPLDRKYWTPVLETVAGELLTPFGLRTLSPRDPNFRSKYFGDLRARDAAYHQGTVWPWLLGPFIDAWLAGHPDDAEGARTLLTPLFQHLVGGACAGSISEIFDAEPPFIPRGCVAQAWSVAELARATVKVATMTGSRLAPVSR
jgi:predicted glycogen debranching enzyme